MSSPPSSPSSASAGIIHAFPMAISVIVDSRQPFLIPVDGNATVKWLGHAAAQKFASSTHPVSAPRVPRRITLLPSEDVLPPTMKLSDVVHAINSGKGTSVLVELSLGAPAHGTTSGTSTAWIEQSTALATAHQHHVLDSFTATPPTAAAAHAHSVKAAHTQQSSAQKPAQQGRRSSISGQVVPAKSAVSAAAAAAAHHNHHHNQHDPYQIHRQHHLSDQEHVRAATSFPVTASLREVGIPQSLTANTGGLTINRTLWQACAFNMSTSGNKTVTSSLQAFAKDDAATTVMRELHHTLDYTIQVCTAVASLCAALRAGSSPAHLFASTLESPMPWLRLHLITPDQKEVWKMKSNLLVHFDDLCSIFTRFGTNYNTTSSMSSTSPSTLGGSASTASTTTMQLSEWLHFCQAANMFPIPVSSNYAEQSFHKAAAHIVTSTTTTHHTSTNSNNQLHHHHGDDGNTNNTTQFLTILSFLEAISFLADMAFSNEVNLLQGGKNGPSRALDRMLNDHIDALATRIVVGTARRCLTDISNKKWIIPHAHALTTVYAYYAEVDETAAEQAKAAHGPASTVGDALCRHRRNMRLQEFTRCLVDAGLATASTASTTTTKGAASSSSSSVGTSGALLTPVEIRQAYFGALALSDQGDIGNDNSGRPREDDPYERMNTPSEFIEAVSRASLLRWGPAAHLNIDLDPSIHELERISKAQAAHRDGIAATLSKVSDIYAAAEAAGVKRDGGSSNSKQASSSTTTTGPSNKAGTTNTSSSPRNVTTPGGGGATTKKPGTASKDGSGAGAPPAPINPRNTRRGSILQDNIITVTHNHMRRGSVIGMGGVGGASGGAMSHGYGGGGSSSSLHSEAGHGGGHMSILGMSHKKYNQLSAVEKELLTPRASAAKLMETLNAADTALEPTLASQMEVFSTFTRWALLSVAAVAEHLGIAVKQPPFFDIPSLIRRLNIEAVTVTATLAAPGSNSTSSGAAGRASGQEEVKKLIGAMKLMGGGVAKALLGSSKGSGSGGGGGKRGVSSPPGKASTSTTITSPASPKVAAVTEHNETALTLSWAVLSSPTPDMLHIVAPTPAFEHQHGSGASSSSSTTTASSSTTKGKAGSSTAADHHKGGASSVEGGAYELQSHATGILPDELSTLKATIISPTKQQQKQQQQQEQQTTTSATTAASPQKQKVKAGGAAGGGDPISPTRHPLSPTVAATLSSTATTAVLTPKDVIARIGVSKDPFGFRIPA